jgi:hypothetical protein
MIPVHAQNKNHFLISPQDIALNLNAKKAQNGIKYY